MYKVVHTLFSVVFLFNCAPAWSASTQYAAVCNKSRKNKTMTFTTKPASFAWEPADFVTIKPTTVSSPVPSTNLFFEAIPCLKLFDQPIIKQKTLLDVIRMAYPGGFNYRFEWVRDLPKYIEQNSIRLMSDENDPEVQNVRKELNRVRNVIDYLRLFHLTFNVSFKDMDAHIEVLDLIDDFMPRSDNLFTTILKAYPMPDIHCLQEVYALPKLILESETKRLLLEQPLMTLTYLDYALEEAREAKKVNSSPLIKGAHIEVIKAINMLRLSMKNIILHAARAS